MEKAMRRKDKKLLREIQKLTSRMQGIKIDTDDIDLFDLLTDKEDDEVQNAMFAVQEECVRLYELANHILSNYGYCSRKGFTSTRPTDMLLKVQRIIRRELLSFLSPIAIEGVVDEHDEGTLDLLKGLDKAISGIIPAVKHVFNIYEPGITRNDDLH